MGPAVLRGVSIRGESFLAVTGVSVAIEPGPVRVTLASINKAQGLKGRITREVRRFLRSPDLEAPDGDLLATLDYAETLRLLQEMSDPMRQQENVAGFADSDLGMDYAGVLGTAIGYLIGLLPVETEKTLLGVESLTPNDLTQAPFRRAYTVVNDPMVALRDMAAGLLVPDQVDALDAAYPELLLEIRGIVTSELIELISAKPDAWRIPYAKDLQLQILLDAPSLDPMIASQIRAAYEKAREEEGGAPKTGPRATPRQDPSITPNQRQNEKGGAEE